MNRKILIFTCIIMFTCFVIVGCTQTNTKVRLDGGANSKIHQFVDVLQGEIEQMKTDMSGKMDISVEAQGDSIVYKFKYLIDIGDVSELRNSLDLGTDSQASGFEALAEQLKDAGVSNGSIIVKYLDPENKIIYTREFK